MHMTPEEYREKDFPVHHEMGDDGPVLELGDIADSIGEKGCILVDVARGEDGMLRIRTVCLPKAGDSEDTDEDEPADLDEALTRTANEAEDGDEVEDDD